MTVGSRSSPQMAWSCSSHFLMETQQLSRRSALPQRAVPRSAFSMFAQMGSVPVLRSLLALSDCVSSVILLYPVSLRKGAPRMYGWRRWRQLVATAVDTLAPFGGRLFYEPAFVPMESEKRQHPRCDARTVMFMDSDGLFYPCCFLPDVLAGSSVAEPRLCDPSYCPVLRRKVDHPSTVQRICPLVIRSSGSSSPFSPADIRVATSSSRRNSNGDTE